MFNSLPSPGLQRSHRNAAAGFSPCLPCSGSPTKVIISKLSEQSFLPEIVAGHIFLKFCGSGQLLSLRINWSPNNQKHKSKWEQKRQILPTKSRKEREMCPVPSAFIFSATPTRGESVALALSSSKARDSQAWKGGKKILTANWQTICLYVLSPYVTFTIFLFQFSLI